MNTTESRDLKKGNRVSSIPQLQNTMPAALAPLKKPRRVIIRFTPKLS